MGEYLDIYFIPLVEQSPSYLKDSWDLILLLQEIKVTEHTILVTVDIESLYTNIQQSDALDAIKWALPKFSNLKKTQINFLIEGINLAMVNNYFWALNSFFKQKGLQWGHVMYPVLQI